MNKHIIFGIAVLKNKMTDVQDHTYLLAIHDGDQRRRPVLVGCDRWATAKQLPLGTAHHGRAEALHQGRTNRRLEQLYKAIRITGVKTPNARLFQWNEYSRQINMKNCHQTPT